MKWGSSSSHIGVEVNLIPGPGRAPLATVACFDIVGRSDEQGTGRPFIISAEGASAVHGHDSAAPTPVAAFRWHPVSVTRADCSLCRPLPRAADHPPQSSPPAPPVSSLLWASENR